MEPSLRPPRVIGILPGVEIGVEVGFAKGNDEFAAPVAAEIGNILPRLLEGVVSDQ